jgi:hypothetical protein
MRQIEDHLSDGKVAGFLHDDAVTSVLEEGGITADRIRVESRP